MKLNGDWIRKSATQAVFAAIEEAGHKAWFVGGCVRNAMLNEPVGDIDIATDARPEYVMAIGEAAGFKAIPTGIDHGTVTLVVQGLPHEVTTFRKDIETDGRRAVVAFSSEMAEDAARRDFTMNALYADRTGRVVDPLGSCLSDIAARQVRFVGKAEDRIREDHLRTLRFFRFHAWYGAPGGGIDPDALAAMAAHTDGIDQLSSERITAEMLKLLAAPDPAPALGSMAEAGILMRILTPASVVDLAQLLHHADALFWDANPIARLAALAPRPQTDRLRLSKKESRWRTAVVEAAEASAGAGELAFRFDAEMAMAAVLLRTIWTGGSLAPNLSDEIEKGAKARFPIQSADLSDKYEGPALGDALRVLEDHWIASEFTLDKAALLAHLAK